MKSKNKKTKLTLLILIICITLGYAALRTSLNINGVASIPNVSWDVYFSNYQNSASTNIDPTTEPSTPAGTKPTTVSYAVVLSQPGDLYEFTIDVVNGGTIDANINLVSKLNGEEIDSENPIPDYLTYTITDQNDQPIQSDHRLNHGVTETYKIKLLFKTDIDPEDLPSEGAVLQLDVELTATQAEKETSIELYTMNMNTGDQNSWVQLGQTIPNDITTYQTPEEVMTASNRAVYLKHKLNGNTNVVEESYVGFVISDAIKTQWKDSCSGDSECEDTIDLFVNGTYYLRGGVNESSLTNKPIYEANKNMMKLAFNYTAQPSVCTDNSTSFECSAYIPSAIIQSDGYANAYMSGYVSSPDDDGAICVTGGYSYCDH